MNIQNLKTLYTPFGPVELLDEGCGEAVLSLHGAMGGYDQSQVLVRTGIGRPSYRYLSISRPGYLGTPLTSGKTPEAQADLYAELLKLLDIGQVNVLAISGGGPSAIHFALRHAEKCRRLVLISTCGGVATTKIPFSFRAMCFLSRWPIIMTMIQEKAEKNLKQTLRRSISDPDIFERMINDAETMALYRTIAIGSFHRLADRVAGIKNDIEVSHTRTYPLENITVPTLVVHGTNDPLLPFREHGKRLASEIPGAQLLTIEGGGHGVIFTHREEVRQRITDFLRD